MDHPSIGTLSNAEIVAMPLDRLALLVLADADRTEAWNWRNWMLGFCDRAESGGRDDAADACSEAWYWLIAHGLIASSSRKGNYDFHGCKVTRAGRVALERGLPFVRASIRLDVDLVPVLEAKVRPMFLLGDFELAALAALREVEISVRTKAGLGTDLLGTQLMQEAFKEGGPLFSPSLHKGESVAQMNLFAGAIGMFKNPPSHRRVDYAEPAQASEVVLLADLLLRILDSIQPAANAS